MTHAAPVDLAPVMAPQIWPAYRGRLAAAAAVGAVLCLAGAFVDLRHTLYAYLVAYCFCLTIVLGMLFFVMLHHVTDAGWSVLVRRSAEQCLAALPILAVLTVPILAGLPWTYSAWVHPIDHAEIVQRKWPYLTVWFFVIRFIGYFAVWLMLMRIMRGRSLAQDESGDPQITLSLRRWSAPGFYLYAITVTFAGIDLLMTLQPGWFSTIFGVYFWSGGAASALALLSLLALGLGRGPLRRMIGSDHLHDLGKLLFAFSVFWAYIAFSQYFLIWYSNIPEETQWFLARWQAPSWKAVCILLPALLFVVPFIVLMSAVTKRRPGVLAAVSILVLVGHYVDIYWLAMPTLGGGVPVLKLWIDLGALLLVGGLCALVVLRAFSRHSLFPVRDPRLAESVALAAA